jgi:hypothetical protein
MAEMKTMIVEVLSGCVKLKVEATQPCKVVCFCFDTCGLDNNEGLKPARNHL